MIKQLHTKTLFNKQKIMDLGMSSDFQLVQTSAQKAGNILGLFEWYDDLCLLRIYKCLYYFCGGDESLMRHWIQTSNKFFESKVPANLVTTEVGIQNVLGELEIHLNR